MTWVLIGAFSVTIMGTFISIDSFGWLVIRYVSADGVTEQRYSMAGAIA